MGNSFRLKDILQRAQAEGWAVGHFNISNLEFLEAIAKAAAALKAPVMIGVSEGERDFLGVGALPAVVDEYSRLHGVQMFLNADHTKSVERAKEAIDASFVSVHIDLSSLPFEENVRGTREVVEYARKKSKVKSQKSKVNIEGEVGYIGGSSTVSGKYIELKPEDYTRPEEARRFVEETGVDRLAVAVGNIHGINLKEPKLDFERIARIKQALNGRAALVLHAGSGIPDEDIKKAIAAGIVNIHISTELREAWKNTLAAELRDPKISKEAPYRLLEPAVDAIRAVVEQKLRLFSSIT